LLPTQLLLERKLLPFRVLDCQVVEMEGTAELSATFAEIKTEI